MPLVETFAAKGFATAAQMFDPVLIGEAHDEYMRQYGDLNADDLTAHYQVGERRVQLPIQLRGPLLDPALYANPLLLGILSGLLGRDILIDNFTCVTALAGAPSQHFHRDHPDPLPLIGPGVVAPPFAVTVAIPLVDLTPATGTTELYPGSHAAGLSADGKPRQTFEPERPYLNRGGCILMDYRLWHRGLANSSQQARPVLYIVYARHWFTDNINFNRDCRINLRIEDAATIPPTARRLFRRLAVKGAFDMTWDDFDRMK